MYFDKDVDPSCRKSNPSFYGVFPDNASDRIVTLSVLWLFTFAHVASKAIRLSLFWTAFGALNTLYYLASELGLVFVVKAMFKDLDMWVPIDSLPASFAVSLMLRFAAKFLTDFAGFLQMRHSYDLG